MPPTLLYLLFFVVWAASACLVWAASLLMLFIPRTRRISGPLCLAMAGTLPFVIAYQILAAPVVATVLLCGWGFWKLLEPSSSSFTTNPLVIVASISVAITAFATISIASLAGLYDGWIIGWKCGQGKSFRVAVNEAPAYHRLKAWMWNVYTKRSPVKH